MLRSYSCTHTDKGPRASRRPTDHDDNDNTTPTFFKGGAHQPLQPAKFQPWRTLFYTIAMRH